MARHSFVLASGQRLEVQPSKTKPGLVLIQVVQRGEVSASCEVDPGRAGVFAQAVEIEAVFAEDCELSALAVKRCDCGWAAPKCGAAQCAGRDVSTAQAGPVAGEWACGIRSVQAVPVVDVSRVGVPA